MKAKWYQILSKTYGIKSICNYFISNKLFLTSPNAIFRSKCQINLQILSLAQRVVFEDEKKNSSGTWSGFYWYWNTKRSSFKNQSWMIVLHFNFNQICKEILSIDLNNNKNQKPTKLDEDENLLWQGHGLKSTQNTIIRIINKIYRKTLLYKSNNCKAKSRNFF